MGLDALDNQVVGSLTTHLLRKAGFVIGVSDPTHAETTSTSKVTLSWETGAASFVEYGMVDTVGRSHHVSLPQSYNAVLRTSLRNN
jgi:hypothetical protein